MTSPLMRAAHDTVLPMRGFEADNLLAFLALLGLLRALETARPQWQPRASWRGYPWTSHLHIAESASEDAVADAATAGIDAIIAHFDVGNRKNVDFDRETYRTHAARLRDDEIGAALVAALTAELPEKDNGKLHLAPLVMMSGQGHQHFLERLITVPRGDVPDMHSPAKIAEALFEPWTRSDDADGFRWDPEEDQRYALRFGDPSKAGAALTAHGANRLAAIGFLSCTTAPRRRRLVVVGAQRNDNGWGFIWPIWSQPLSLAAVECLLAHPDLPKGPAPLRELGVIEVFFARRIQNGKFVNVTRAMPIAGARQMRVSTQIDAVESE
jgi:hypothetical protein